MKSHGILPPVPAFLTRDRASHEHFMRIAIKEASRGIGLTAPNPVVGAVLVKGGAILATGYHHAAGLPHAEIEAMRKARFHSDSPSPITHPLKGCTLYVTLEPCSSHGRTPPCTEAIISAGIARVVYGATDPDHRHQGVAAKILEKAGIEVLSGILAEECAALNAHWNHRISTGLPWIIAKVGMSLDGRIDSPPHRRWITSEASRHEAMRLRASVDGILVGGGTIRADNPELTIRGIKLPEGHPQPWRIIWSRSGELPKKAKVFTDVHKARTLMFTERSLKMVLKELGKRGISSLLVEGGGWTLGEAFDRKLVDEVRFFIAPVIQGGKIPAVGGRGFGSHKSAPGLCNLSSKAIGSDVMISGKIDRSKETSARPVSSRPPVLP